MARHSGFLLQSTYGERGNFELVALSPLGGMNHFWRDNDSPALPWNGPVPFGCADISGVSTVLGESGLYQLVACAEGQLAHYWRGERWQPPVLFGDGVSGNPAMIETTDGMLEVFVPLRAGGFAHYQKPAGQPWAEVGSFRPEDGTFESLSVIMSSFGDPGHLEIIAVLRDNGPARLVHYWRPYHETSTWYGPIPIDLGGLEPSGVPAFLQGRFGSLGNFEVVTPLASGGMAHITRDNDAPGLPWSAPVVFGSGAIQAVSFIQSNFGEPHLGNFELVALAGTRTDFYWRSDQTLEWYGPYFIFEEASADPAVHGRWSVEYVCKPVGIHAVLLHTNRVLFFAYHEENHAFGVSSVLDLQSGEVATVPQGADLFCAGQAILPDGRVLVSGGHHDTKAFFLFEPDAVAGEWRELPPMPDGRWYPTCTVLPDGRVFIISGSRASGGGPVNDTYAFYDPATGLQPPQPAPFLNEVIIALYPFVFLLPSGKLFVFASDVACLFDPQTEIFEPERFPAVWRVTRTYPLEGTAVLLPLLPELGYNARIMTIGGGGAPVGRDAPATENCEVLDFGQSPLEWKLLPPLSIGRVMPDAVLLPDGNVLVMNGSFAGKADDAVNPVFTVELYDTANNQWHAMSPLRVPRLYHSTALLLPDGTVMTAGTDEAFNVDPFHYPEYRLEVFRPPYLFRGPRPQILTAPESIKYGESFDLDCDDAAAIQSAALIRTGAVTHSFNNEQRHVGLRILAKDPALTLEAPPNANIAPPGYYLLFVLNGEGVPSVGRFVNVR